MKTTALSLLCSATAALAFSPSATQRACVTGVRNAEGALFLSADATTTTTEEAAAAVNVNDSLEIPLTYTEMVQQVSQCMSDAYEAGTSRQIVRILLPRDPDWGNLGETFEADSETADRTKSQEMKLVPNDESWQGGIMQLYRAAAPTTKDILRQLSPTTAATGVPPNVIEDRCIDESGVDGMGLFYTQAGASGEGTSESDADENAGGEFGGLFGFGGAAKLPTLAENDMCVFVQPSQETADSIDKLSTDTGPSLMAILNPQWRNVDDALDSASKSDGVFGSIASFLGGKGSVLRRLDELGYRPTYTLEGYVCKGGNVRLIKRYDSDWVVFAENDEGDNFLRVGELKDRPTYQDVEKMLDDKGVGYKYARDLGMAPKL